MAESDDLPLLTRIALLEARVRLISLALKALVGLVVGLAVTYMFRGG